MISLNFNSHSELIALSKALNFIKFKCHDVECSHLSGSPYIGELYNNVLSELDPYYKKTNDQYAMSNMYIENDSFALETIKYHISNINDWDQLSDEVKSSTLREYIKPLNFKEETIGILMEYGNNFHASPDFRSNTLRCNGHLTMYDRRLKDDPEVFLWNEKIAHKISAFLELNGKSIADGSHDVSLDLCPFQNEVGLFFEGAIFKVDYKGSTIGEVEIKSHLT